MTVRYDQLSLPRDALFACNLILQLCNFCYVCVASWPEDQKRALFAHCVRLYRQNRPSSDRLPFAATLGRRALETVDYGLWQVQGKLYQLIA